MTEGSYEYQKFDDVPFPVVVCGAGHRIIYKNKTAKRSLPVPKTGGCLLKYVSERDRLRLLYQKKHRFVSICVNGNEMTALVYEGRNGTVFAFPLFLQFIGRRVGNYYDELTGLSDGYDSIFEFSQTADRKVRAQRQRGIDDLRSACCRIYKRFEASEPANDRFGVFDAVVCIMSAGREVFRKYKYRVDYDASGLADSEGRFVSFAPFAFAVLQTVIFMIGLSANNAARVDFSDKGKYIEADIKCPFDPGNESVLSENGFDLLAARFPGEKDNINELGFITGYEKWRFDIRFDENDRMLHAVIGVTDRQRGSSRLFAKTRVPRHTMFLRERSAVKQMVHALIID